jgi:hypothetical protein
MSDDRPNSKQIPRGLRFFRVSLFRLLAINLAAGIAVAALLVGGLLALDPFHLRDLIFADSDPVAALGLLLFGFVVTFGSTAMGSAIMAMGKREMDDETPRGRPRVGSPRPACRESIGRLRRPFFKEDAEAKLRQSRSAG